MNVLPVRYLNIAAAANFRELSEEYATECAVPDASPQHQMYESMEKAGALQCFGAYEGDDLIGFASVLTSVMPHNGKRVGTIESIFVTAPHRDSGAGDELLTAAVSYAGVVGCICLVCTARIASAFERSLARRDTFELTHSVFTRWL